MSGQSAEKTHRFVADEMRDELAPLAERIRAIVDWFETVPAKAREHNGNLVGHYVEAADWRAVRSELNSITNTLRRISSPSGEGVSS